MKRIAKFKEMTREDLQQEERSLAEQLFRLRFQKATGQLENAMKIRQIRRDLARVKTRLTEKQKA